MASEYIITAKYRYSGGLYHNLAHKYGKFYFVNSDLYEGECKYGKTDGFGVYTYADGSQYTGFFSYGQACGIGTFTTPTSICKGTWRLDRKHGQFYKTDREQNKTYKQVWIRDVLISSRLVQYIAPEYLQTTKKKQHQPHTVHHTSCIGCTDAPADMVIISCGHMVLCQECITQCSNCPMCRGPLDSFIKVYRG